MTQETGRCLKQLTGYNKQLPSPLVIELPLKGSIVIIKIMEKNKGHRACFLRYSCRQCAPPAFLAIGASFKAACTWMVEESTD